ncbi:InaD-like protein [Collichthys lucidus]|uniref:InaD-like protein n=1 Tax=Collichthys lucidus TaxID=240159 RepID=A0A4U5UNY1_COLLU|nr:InaD-like protein [Collichthys lucidus]
MFENVPTVSAAERHQVLGALERLQAKLVQREEWTHSETMGNLRETLQSPLFNHILTLQHSIKQLRNQRVQFLQKGSADHEHHQFSSSSAPPNLSASSCIPTSGSSPPIHQTPPSSDLLQKWIVDAAKGRHTDLVSLTRPLSGGLGFSVVGLNPAGTSSQGVFVKHIQPGGVAHRDGRLQERDQILVINGSPLEAGISQQQALSLLQQPGETVELVVARDRPPNASSQPAAAISTPGLLCRPGSDPPSQLMFCPVSIVFLLDRSWPLVAVKWLIKDQWGHMEEIELVNDGSGLGFGIVGGKTSGVVVRTLVSNSVADRDGRLRTGDHILRIGATPTSGLTSDQVVKVLQGCGSQVTMLIARDPRGTRSTAPPPPPPPDSAPVTALPPRPPDVPPQRQLSKTPNLEGYEIHEVPLTKKDGQSLGISIIGYNPLTSQGETEENYRYQQLQSCSVFRIRTGRSEFISVFGTFQMQSGGVNVGINSVCALRVEVWPEEGQSLGLSIVGGRHVIKRLRNGEELKGIFIKQVLSNSPAAKTRCLKTGDKILEQPAVAPPPLRQPPPYRPPNQSEQEQNSDLEQVKGQ